MLEYVLRKEPSNAPLQVLCLGAHADDVEIGCGGTLLQLAQSPRPLEVTWIVFSATESRRREAVHSAGVFLQGAAKKDVAVLDFRDGFFPYVGADIKEYFESLKMRVEPDLIFTHFRKDLHQDHRVICDLSWNTFRNHLVLEYEIPKYDGDFGSPSLFVPLDESMSQRKIDTILAAFQTQEHRHWFSADLFRSVLRVRGMEAAAPSGYAEAFFARKLLFRP